MESIEDHLEHFIVIVLRAVDDSGNATSHNHSIVIDVRHQHGKFDVVTLMAALQGTDIESLNVDFISKQLLPWQEGTARSVVKKLRGVWLTLDRYAIVTATKAASAKKGIKWQPAGAERGDKHQREEEEDPVLALQEPRPKSETLPNQGTAERALGREASQVAQRGQRKGKQQPLA